MPRKPATVTALKTQTQPPQFKALRETRTWKDRQAWEDERLFVVVKGGHKVRTRIKRDAYDFQSYAVVDLWNGTEWKRVTSLDITFWPLEAKASYVTQFTSKSFDKLVDALMTEALLILGD